MATTKKKITDKKKSYNKEYKDERRIVTYVDDSETKTTLVQHAEDKGVSLSAITGPVLKEYADGLRRKNI